jgi:hypothetical protein
MIVPAAAGFPARLSGPGDPLTWFNGPHPTTCPLWTTPGRDITGETCETCACRTGLDFPLDSCPAPDADDDACARGGELS